MVLMSKFETCLLPADQQYPLFRSALLQSEALLVRYFFEVCQEKGFSDPLSQMLIWGKLIARKHMFIELCERSQLNKYSNFLLPQQKDQDYKELCYHLFCLFLYDLEKNLNKAKVFWLEVQTIYQPMVLDNRQ